MDVALGPSGGEILAAECAAPRAGGVYPRPALQADRICAPPLTPFLHRLGLPASVHRDVRDHAGLPLQAGSDTVMKEERTARCNYLQCRSNSAALIQHPRREPGDFL